MRKGRWRAAWWGLAPAVLLVLACAPSPPSEISGPDLARRLGCFACHSLKAPDGGPGPSLARVGSRLSGSALAGFITHPRSRRPQARMPSYAHLRPQELQALVDYLESLL